MTNNGGGGRDADFVAKTFASGKEALDHLSELPAVVRFFGFIPVVFLALFSYLAITGEQPAKIIAIYALVAMFLLCIIFAFVLSLSGLSAQKKAHESMQATLQDKIVLDAPVTGMEGGREIKFQYDVFVSAPMASKDDSVRTAYNEKIKGIVNEIMQKCNYKAFYSGFANSSTKNDDEPGIALSHNVKIMRASTRYMFVYTEYEPTSAFIELGMALALGKPSVWFVMKGVRQPFLMQGHQAGGSAGLPHIKVYEISDLDRISQLIEQHGTELFVNADDKAG